MTVNPYNIMNCKYNGVMVPGAVVMGMTGWSGSVLLLTGEKRMAFRHETANKMVEFRT